MSHFFILKCHQMSSSVNERQSRRKICSDEFKEVKCRAKWAILTVWATHSPDTQTYEGQSNHRDQRSFIPTFKQNIVSSTTWLVATHTWKVKLGSDHDLHGRPAGGTPVHGPPHVDDVCKGSHHFWKKRVSQCPDFSVCACVYLCLSVFECVHVWVCMSEMLDAFQENQIKSVSFNSDFLIYKNLHLEYIS